jgi:hypothetical protein
MMKRNLLFIILALGLKVVFAQTKEELAPCGTPLQSQEQLRQLNAGERSGGDTILYVPLTIHNISNDSASAFFSVARILDGFDRLNRDYAASKIQFFMEGAILHKRNTLWNNHKTIPEGANMMFANNIKNTINIYVTSNAAGNCGYNLPYAGIAISKGCLGPNDHTWAHELGHGLSLPHPFLGWEGNKYNPNKPTPTRVTYDYTLFKDSLILGKTIIDTAFVELVDGSNCAVSADQICDTKPDYIAERWTCDATKQSATTFKDPDGKTFRVDGSLIMSYANDACQDRFSAQEIAKMRSVLLGKKRFLLYNQVPKLAVDTKPSLILLPLNNSQISPKNMMVQWEKVQNAAQYVLQISRSASFSFIESETVTAKNEAMIDLDANRTYFARVRAFNSHFSGTPWSDKITFKTGELPTSSSDKTAFSKAVFFPNPLNNNTLLQSIVSVIEPSITDINIMSITGQTLFSQQFSLLEGENQLTIPITFPKGIYFVEMKNRKGKIVQKIVVN